MVCASLAERPASAAPVENFNRLKLLRFEFDNDSFVGSDDAFTAGWSFQIHSPLRDEWTPGLANWIGRFPTLRDDGAGGRIVRWAWGVTQTIMTPDDITIAAPQPDDLPWAGLLGGYVSWTAYDNHRLAALQLYLGCMGPCSQGEDAQKLVHDGLGFGESPEGWANQLDDELLYNVNYEFRQKLWSRAGHYETSGFGQDLSVGAQAGVGSFATYAMAWVEYRFGWDVPRGFAKFPDPPALGIALDPVYLDPQGPQTVRRSWRPYFTLAARVRRIDTFAPLEGGPTQNGGFHAAVNSMPGTNQLLVGAHFAKVPVALHATYYRYFNDGDVTRGGRDDFDWVNLSFEYRF